MTPYYKTKNMLFTCRPTLPAEHSWVKRTFHSRQFVRILCQIDDRWPCLL